MCDTKEKRRIDGKQFILQKKIKNKYYIERKETFITDSLQKKSRTLACRIIE